MTTRSKRQSVMVTGLLMMFTTAVGANEHGLARMAYNHPGLVVDLGVGLWAWPLPMDYDEDGDLDLVVACPDKPYRGVYFFENANGSTKMPIFKPAVRVGEAHRNMQPSYVDGEARILIPGRELIGFRANGFSKSRPIHSTDNVHTSPRGVRANQWRYCDFDGDGVQDLLVGVGDWTEYGWDNAFDSQGRWTNGPLHGYVYLLRNAGTNEAPRYDEPRRLRAAGHDIDVYGMPSPNLSDFDGDGDLDLLCGAFLDGFTYFENVGSRSEPQFTDGRQLTADGAPIRMELQMIVPVAIDWDRDGDVDLVVGDEDGRVALIEHTGRIVDRMPQFQQPKYFQQAAADVKFGALVTPVSVDWDDDGDEDLVCGNTAGYIGFIENLDGGDPPRWAPPRYLTVGDEPIRIQAGPNGSIQGPCEAKWGYTTLSVADWDHDDRLDLIVNSIWGRVVWYRNVGTSSGPKLVAAAPIEVAWSGTIPKPEWNWWDPVGNELVTQWRTTPVVVDFTGDGLNDLLTLDHEGYLTVCVRARRDGRLVLLPPRRAFRMDGPSHFDGAHRPQSDADGLVRLNVGQAGKSGRRKLCVADWDGDGRLDLLVNSRNVNWLRNVSDDGETWTLRDEGPLDTLELAGHTTSPTVVDWDDNGVPDLLVGAEDGFLYAKQNPRAAKARPARREIHIERIFGPEVPGRYKHPSSITELDNGDLYLVYYGGSGEYGDDTAVYGSRKVKGSQQWTAPAIIADTPNRSEGNAVIWQGPGGRVWLFYVTRYGETWSTSRIKARFSEDGAQSWSDPFLLSFTQGMMVRSHPIVLTDGNYLLPIYHETGSDRELVPPDSTSLFLRYDPQTHAWTESHRIRSPNGNIQPAVVQITDTHLIAYCRRGGDYEPTDDGYVIRSESHDAGRTWSPGRNSPFPNPNAAVDFIRLRNGHLLFVYNDSMSRRTPLTVAISTDQDRTWPHRRNLVEGPGSFAYPCAIQTKDGRVHIVFTSHGRTVVNHAVFDETEILGSTQ